MSKGKGLILLQIKQVQRIKKNLQYYISKNKFHKRWDTDLDSYMALTPSSSRKGLDKKQKKNSFVQQDQKRGIVKSKTPQFQKNKMNNSRTQSKNNQNNQKKFQKKGAMPKGYEITQRGRIVKTNISDEEETNLFNQIISKNKNGKLEQVIKNMSKNKKKKSKTPKSISHSDHDEFYQMKVVISDENKLGKQQTVYKKPYIFNNLTDMLQKNEQKQEKQRLQKQKQMRQKQMRQKEMKQKQLKQKQLKQKEQKQSKKQNSNFFSILKLFGGGTNKAEVKKEDVKVQKEQKKIQEPKKVQIKQQIKEVIPQLKIIPKQITSSQKNINQKFSTKDRSIKLDTSRFHDKNDIYNGSTSDRQKSQKSERSLKAYPTINFTERQQHQLRSKYWNLNSKLDQLKNKIKQQCFNTYKKKYDRSVYEQSDQCRKIDAAGLYKRYSPLKKLRNQLQKRHLQQQRERNQKSLTKQLKLQQILRTQNQGQFPRKKRNSNLYYSQKQKLSKDKQNSSSRKR